MLVLISIFIETFSLSFILLFLDGVLTMSSIWISFSISILVTVILLRACLIYPNNEAMLFQSIVYKKIINNFLVRFFKNIFYTIRLTISNVTLSTVVDSMEIDTNNWNENAIICNCINISSDIIISLIDNKNIKIHSINLDEYTRNVIYDEFANLSYKMYDEKLVW